MAEISSSERCQTSNRGRCLGSDGDQQSPSFSRTPTTAARTRQRRSLPVSNPIQRPRAPKSNPAIETSCGCEVKQMWRVLTPEYCHDRVCPRSSVARRCCPRPGEESPPHWGHQRATTHSHMHHLITWCTRSRVRSRHRPRHQIHGDGRCDGK